MALHDPAPPSAGEIGGIVAGTIAVLGAIGAAIRFLLLWFERRVSRRAAELAEREKALEVKRAEFEARVEERLSTLETENRAWRLAFHLVAADLRQRDPKAEKLILAEKVLAAAMPLEMGLPNDWLAMVSQLAEPDAPPAN